MMKQLRNEMHKHNTYTNIYKSWNTFRKKNKYYGAYTKETKDVWNDHTNFDDVRLTCRIQYLIEINQIE